MHGDPDPSTEVDPEKNKKEIKSTYLIGEKRSFNHLTEFSFPKKEVQPFFIEKYAKTVSDQELDLREQIDKTYDKVLSENRFVDFLDANALIDFPIGLKSDIGVLSYVILIDSLILSPTDTRLFASMSFEAPGLGKLHFRGTDIKFSKSGGIVDGGILELVGDYPIPLPGDKSQLIIKATNQKTFVEFDCNGFKQMSVDGSMVFSRDMLIPVDGNGNDIPDDNVALDFTTTVTDWNDLLVNASISDFEITELKDVHFSVGEAILDLSDFQNAPSVQFPASYYESSPFLQSGNPELWRGVFIQNLTVTLPDQFKTKGEDGTGHEVTFTGSNMLIDNQGFTGEINGNNLIPIERGKIGNWNFSLEEFHVSILTNSVTSAGFNGKIDIPISSRGADSEETGHLFNYTALIRPGNEYLFNVTNPNQIDFNLWNASEVTLEPSSYVEVKLVDGQFRPKAHLSGNMTIEASLKSEDGQPDENKNNNITLADIRFENLEVQTIRPYVKVGAFSLGTAANNFGGFPLSINDIGGGQTGDELYLDIDLNIALTGEEEGAFGAGGGVRIVSEAIENGDNLSYRFKELELQRFAIDVDQGALKFNGTLNFYTEDPIYGNGISGTISATFNEKIGLDATAIFGTKDGMKYWYVDALADLGNNVPIATGVYLNRFGGGASYHMELGSESVGSPLGKTASGMVYVPSREAGLGLKAMVGLKGNDEKLFHADATFEMAFRKGGGVRYINFRGNAYLLTEPTEVSVEELKDQAKQLANAAATSDNINASDNVSKEILGSPDTKGAQMYAGINIHFDFDNKTLHANLDVDINVAGAVTGGGSAVMHFTPSEWYIYIGRPEYENRFNLNLLGLAQADAYFVMGSTVPDTPPPPENVSDILGDIDLNYMDDLNALEDGAGIGFGASLRIDTGNKNFLIFYGRFQAGVGFDVMLKDYGGATCTGRGSLGIDGWYANGQAYAYFDGEIGIRVKVLGRTKRIEILEIGAAVVLQAKLPNPFWARGIVGGEFSVLGGLVKGQCSFQVTIGEECDLQNNSSVLEGVDVIAQLTPSNGARDIDVFSSPQAVFNYELEKSYHTTGYNDERITFKIGLDKFEINGPNGPVEADVVWNNDKTISVLKTPDVLPPLTELSLDVSVSFQELKNGIWEIAKSDGEELSESKSLTFTTGEAPDYIPENNVAYSYPTRRMLNFYKDEYEQGYVKLIRGQDYLFENQEFDEIVRFTSNGQEQEVPLTYDAVNDEITFQISPNLQNDRIYQLNFISVPKLQTNIEGNVSASETSVNNEGVDATVRTRSATGSVKNYEELEIYKSYFRTSRYSRFVDKISSVNPSRGWRKPVTPGVHLIGSNINGPEPFSLEEIYGVAGKEKLIRMVADLSGNAWYEQAIEPLIYSDYPFDISRDPSKLGRVPIKAVVIYQYPYNYLLEDSQINSGQVSFSSRVGRFDYELAYIMNKDLRDMQTQAANLSFSSDKIHTLLTSSFPRIKGGEYPLEINYHLPGRNTITSSYRHTIVNPIE